ncbi:unnamed protein product [Rotaria sp. Silwood2]|nr:unnamed protein product [Rotaria sp. Silwood2]CAF4149643.1 unnamed protein product [Rotaria sp. Silwood2]
MNLSKFEYLPSELIVERSDSLNGCDLYYAFNPRINTILELVLFQNVIEKEFISFSCMFSQQCHRRCVTIFERKYYTTCWFVQCRLRDRGRFFRLSTIQSPIITILYWPDGEVLLDSTAITVYPNVTHIELWWNLLKSAQAICLHVRSIQLYGAGNYKDVPVHPNIFVILQNPLIEYIIINDNLPIIHIRFASILSKSSNNIQTLT